MCHVRLQITDQLLAEVKRIIDLHNLEALAIVNGNVALDGSLTTEIRAAQRRRAELLETLRQHVSTHGC